MTRARPLAVALLLGVVAALHAEPPSAPDSDPTDLPASVRETAARLRDEALRGTQAYDLVRSLTFEVGPRLAGSRGLGEAVAWGLRTLQRLGFQNVHGEKVMVPHWERGTIAGEILSPWRQPVALAALGGSVGTPEEGIEAEVVEVPSLAALDRLGADRVRGRIVFFDTVMQRTRDGSGYGKAVGVRGSGAARAGKLGALAVLIRSIGTGGSRFPHTGAMHYEAGGPQIPAAALAIPDADLLAAEIASGKPVIFRLKSTSRLLPDVEAANVVGEIAGSETPGEVVLLGAHLDSWDLGTGAIDDAAGCGIVIEAARRIGQLPRHPRRTVRVVLFANEEFGTSGAKAYAQAHAAELPRHVLAGESDLGSGRVWRIQSRVAPDHLPGVAALARLLAPLGVEAGGNEAHGGTDVAPLTPAGVPLLDLDQDATTYFDNHHTANDTLDIVDAKDLDQNVAAWAAVAYAVADLPGDLGRAPAGKPEE